MLTHSTDPVKSIYTKLPAAQRLCFLTTFSVMLLTHLYALTNKIPNWDELTQFDYYGLSTQVGRWLLPYTHMTGARFSTPMINGMILILAASVSACLMISLFELTTQTAVVAFAVIWATWISFCSILMFMFTAHSYGIALLFSVTAVYMTCRKKYGWIAGIFLLICSLAVYQAFLPFAVSLFLIDLILALVKGEPVKTVCLAAVRYALTTTAATLLYLMIARSYNLSDCRGAAQMGQISLSMLPFQILRACHRILQYFVSRPPAFQDGLLHMMSLTAAVLCVVLPAVILWQKRLWRDPARLILLILLCLLLPLTCSLIYVMVPDADAINMLMVFPYVLVYLFPVLLWERTEKKPAFIGLFLLCVSLLTGFAQYRVINEAYLRNRLAFDRIHALSNRIMVRLEQAEGYTYDQPVVIVGEYYPEPDPVSSYDPGAGRYLTIEGISTEHGLFTSGVRHSFIKTYLGIDGVRYADPDTVAEIASTAAFQSMPTWPADGCIRRINDLWVVKLSDRTE